MVDINPDWKRISTLIIMLPRKSSSLGFLTFTMIRTAVYRTFVIDLGSSFGSIHARRSRAATDSDEDLWTSLNLSTQRHPQFASSPIISVLDLSKEQPQTAVLVIYKIIIVYWFEISRLNTISSPDDLVQKSPSVLIKTTPAFWPWFDYKIARSCCEKIGQI